MFTSIFILVFSKYIYARRLRKELQQYGRYTIGITTNSTHKILEKFFTFYSYAYKGKVYDDYVWKKTPVLPGQKFLVYLDSKTPKFNVIDFTHTVTPAESRQIIHAPYPHDLNGAA